MLRAVVLVPLLVVGLVSFIFVRAHAGDGDTLVARQQHAQALTAASVARVVKAAPDPSTDRGHGTAATCKALGAGALSNPWRCAIRYRSGRDIQWTVTISADGSYVGDHQVVRYQGQTLRAPGSIDGCCIAIP